LASRSISRHPEVRECSRIQAIAAAGERKALGDRPASVDLAYAAELSRLGIGAPFVYHTGIDNRHSSVTGARSASQPAIASTSNHR